MMFAYEWKCAWGHADPHGIAYYPRLVVAMNRAGQEFMNSLDLTYHELPDSYGINFPVVSMETEYETPVEVGDVLTITVEPDLGRTSLTLQYTATNEREETVFHGEEKHVCIDTTDNQTTPIPDDVRDALNRGSTR